MPKRLALNNLLLLIIVTGKTQNYKFQIYSSPEKLAADLRRQDSHFSAKSLHVHFATKRDFNSFKEKKKKDIKSMCQVHLAQIWLEI